MLPDQEILKKAEESIEKEFKENINAHYAISKDIVLPAGGILGILVSLTNLTKDSFPARLAFLLSLCLLSLSILTLVASMLWRLLISRHQLKRSLWYLNSVRAGKEFVEPPYRRCFFSSYRLLLIGIICLLLSMVSLVVFIGLRIDVF